MAGARYQVFISSTYIDLIEERQKVLQAILDIGHFPAGMEFFPAASQEQFEYIKRVIEDCDYYILIIGGRYGSISDRGISYTEREFDYALELGKPVMSFLFKDLSELPGRKIELAEIAQRHLHSFREKVASNRLVKYWSSASELAGQVLVSLNHAIRYQPQIGWVKSNLAQDPALIKILEDKEVSINNMQKEILDLKSQISQVDDALEAEIQFKIKVNDVPRFENVRAVELLRHFAPILSDGLRKRDVGNVIYEYILHRISDNNIFVSDSCARDLIFYLNSFDLVVELEGDGEIYLKINSGKNHIFRQIFKPENKFTQSNLYSNADYGFFFNPSNSQG